MSIFYIRGIPQTDEQIAKLAEVENLFITEELVSNWKNRTI